MGKATAHHPYRKTQILTANPGELMLLLYNAAICFCEQAKGKIAEKRYGESHELLVKVENIVMELSAGLRRDVYPDLVDNLSRLYEFVFYRLFEANVSHSTRCIDEAMNVLAILRDGWVQAIEKANKGEAARDVSGNTGRVELSA